MDVVGDRDLKIVQAQLGRQITNVVAVLKYCSFGFPVLVLSYPVRDDRPFPTIHYLTCPHLVREISRLEEKGWISVFENRIASNETFRSAYMLAHEAVRTKRTEMLAPEDDRWKEVLSRTGAGGINELSRVKCLHLHVADFLAGIANPVGKEVYDMIEAKECTSVLCAKFERKHSKSVVSSEALSERLNEPCSIVAEGDPDKGGTRMANIFLLFDFQNQPVDVQLVYSEVLKHGRVVGGKAYGSWDRHKMAAFALYNYGIELIEVPETEFLPNKKGNDIRLAVDCIEVAFHNNTIDTFFLVTGDADFTALVYKLKSYGKKVVALARMKSTSYELISAVDLFIPYEDIVKNEKLADPIDRLCEELEIFLKRAGKECTVENISKFLSAFNVNPTKYGAESMNHLVELVHERKVQKPEKLKDIKQLLLKEAIFGDLRTKTLVEVAKKYHVELSDLKTALEILLHENILSLSGEKYEVNRSKAFFATLLEKYPVNYSNLLDFIEKTYKAFQNNRVKSLNQLLQSEFRLPSSEFRSYLEACKRSGCLRGIDDSDYISYSTPAKLTCELKDFVVATFCYFLKRVLAQTFVFKDELQFLKELIFLNDEKLFEECLSKLLADGELVELGGVYFYTPS